MQEVLIRCLCRSVEIRIEKVCVYHTFKTRSWPEYRHNRKAILCRDSLIRSGRDWFRLKWNAIPAVQYTRSEIKKIQCFRFFPSGAKVRATKSS